MDTERYQLIERAQYENQLQEQLLQVYRTLFAAVSGGLIAFAGALLAGSFSDTPSKTALWLSFSISIAGIVVAYIWSELCEDRAALTHYWRTRILRIERGEAVEQDLLAEFLRFRHCRPSGSECQSQLIERQYKEELRLNGVETEENDNEYGLAPRDWLNLMPKLFGLLFVATLVLSIVQLAS